ncbi:hypothetical protein ACVIWV_001790 [Bradyrhizobium diazoefficiens]|jgi:hypothetical protein|uniref:Uncharacterized protein n=1 Tax=Bradyrhizobium diazoefficiens TaxID=1355477 RepID=A0A0E4BJF1_9BRAD|nr:MULTISPECIES: hypothetical protein [Bradyrhizobium]MBP1064130.1 hypothetical protein [Bradyrhizobium japonicum]APO52029.1 hypothetical protein BD122_17190 [Bradyrhizobium diazoefficiens]KOY08283.1 hypothetical protein AF336_22570 [Bradyrhizobium diazoefficiens]MBR0865170.1 hypothetical protein [Bradyrhizobium diazoefficiens]MBR0889704.1 hypothetical protein [Bradyrhizobium diazoefficiens]
MQIAVVKCQPKRRCRIPRRPHPSLDYFFGRLERADGAMDDDAELDNSELDHSLPSQRRH